MITYSRKCLTKKEKFRQIFSRISDHFTIQSYFEGLHTDLYSLLTEEQKNIFDELWSIYMDNPCESKSNDDKFGNAILKAKNLYQNAIKYIPEPAMHITGFPVERFEDAFPFLNAPEDDGILTGSNFVSSISNENVIRKLGEEVPHVYGLIKVMHSSEYEFLPPINFMLQGRYEINGFRFDVITSPIVDEIDEIRIYASESNLHPILQFIKELPDDKKTNNTEVECHICRDGGCVHCEPSLFISGNFYH